MIPWYITLGLELFKLILPMIKKIREDKKPNPVAAKEMVSNLRSVVVGEPTDLKRL